jgi:hypothetical protein
LQKITFTLYDAGANQLLLDKDTRTFRARIVQGINPNLAGGFCIEGGWLNQKISQDCLFTSFSTLLNDPLIVYFEEYAARVALVFKPEPAYTYQADLSFAQFPGYHCRVGVEECRLLTVLEGNPTPVDVTRWASATGLSEMFVKTRARNVLYAAGCYLLAEGLVKKSDLAQGETPQERIAEITGDQDTLARLGQKKAGNIPINFAEEAPPLGYVPTDVLPDIRKTKFTWASFIGGIYFLSIKEKGVRANTISPKKAIPLLFADVLAKDISKQKMSDPEEWQKFFEEQANQLEGLARVYRAIADIARMNSEFDKLKKKP